MILKSQTFKADVKEDLDQDDKIWQALKEACAEDFVKELPHGLDTRIKEGGLGFSEGQLQRLAIARALFTDRPVLLLDEATSALDEEPETRVLKNLQALTNRTILIVTHRPAALSICDRQIHIDGVSVTMQQIGEKQP